MKRRKKAVDPVDDYLEAKKTAAARRREDDVNMVTEWQKQRAAGNVDPVLHEQLFKRFEPVRRKAVGKYRAPLTGPGFDVKSRTLMAEALGSWSPQGGAAPVTHITNTMKRLYRENLQQQSIQHTEGDAGLFGKMDQAKAELEDELERDPSHDELLGRMNELLPAHRRIDAQRLQQLQTRRGSAALASGLESNPMQYQSQLERQKLDMLPYDLNPQETQVYNMLMGRGGKAVTSTNAIASRMGVSAPTVSRIRKAIALKAGVTEDQLAATRKQRKY